MTCGSAMITNLKTTPILCGTLAPWPRTKPLVQSPALSKANIFRSPLIGLAAVGTDRLYCWRETLWSKRRILEVYLNMAEFGEGVFGVEAAAQHHFQRPAVDLGARQSALLAAVLPAPQSRDAGDPEAFVLRRAQAIIDGAATIARDDRSACFDG